MRHVIESVERGSVAYRHGLRAGDVLVSLDGEPVVDEIDYQALIAGSRVRAVVERGGEERTVDIRKQEGEPLGLHFGRKWRFRPAPAETTACSASSARCRRACAKRSMCATTTGAFP